LVSIARAATRIPTIWPKKVLDLEQALAMWVAAVGWPDNKACIGERLVGLSDRRPSDSPAAFDV
jgi:hypothetical protein